MCLCELKTPAHAIAFALFLFIYEQFFLRINYHIYLIWQWHVLFSKYSVLKSKLWKLFFKQIKLFFRKREDTFFTLTSTHLLDLLQLEIC